MRSLRWLVALSLGTGCGEVVVPDAGAPGSDAAQPRLDGGERPDAASVDAGLSPDSGAGDSGVDAGAPDAGAPDAGGPTLTVRLTGAGEGLVQAAALGLSCPPDCSAEVARSQRVTLTSSAARSSIFVDWSESSCGNAATCNVTVEDDVEVTAQFALRQHRITVIREGDGSGTVSSAPAGIDCGLACAGDWFHGSSLTLSAAAQPGSTFAGWTGGGCEAAGTGDCPIMVAGPVTVRASFTVDRQRVLVTIDGLGDGRVRALDGQLDCRTGGLGTCQALYPRGGSTTLVAEPSAGSSFSAWSGACAGTGPCNLTVNGNLSVGATFEPIMHDVTVSLGGPGAGRVTSTPAGIDCGSQCTAARPEGSTLTLTASPAPNHRFVGWSGACAGTAPTCNLSVTSALQTTALFEFEPRLVAGFWHVCATNRAGSLRCWGDNAAGQLGYGHTNVIGDDETPASVGDVPVGTAVEAVALGFEHTCAVLRGGAVRCWGNGGDGRLGTGSTTPRPHAGQAPDVALPHPAVAVAAGFAHSCALLDNGDVYCWGSNQFGQLGYGGGFTERQLPVAGSPVPVGGPVAQLIAGSRMTCARLTNGDVRCWGDAELGQLGYGNTTDIGLTDTPANHGPVPLGGPVAELSPVSGAHTCARLTNGDVRCWGSGANGRLGYGSDAHVGNMSLPSQQNPLVVPGSPLLIAAGGAHTCAMFSSLDARCWGRNFEGALGYGNAQTLPETLTQRPLDMPGISFAGGIATITAGGFFSCARYPNDSITCWGDFSLGQLGYGDQGMRGNSTATTPAQNGLVPVF